MFGSGSVFQIRIRIQEAPEYGSNTDPDPQQWKTEKVFLKLIEMIIYKKVIVK